MFVSQCFSQQIAEKSWTVMKQSGKTSCSLDTNRIILGDVIALSFSGANTKF